MSLRFSINLLITLIMLLFALAGAAMLLDSTRTQIREEMHAGTAVTVQLLSGVARNIRMVPDLQAQQRLLLEFLDQLGRVRANEIRFFSHQGTQLYGSPPSTYKTGRDAPNWYSNLVTPKGEPVRLTLPAGELQILPNASRAALDAWDDLKRIGWIFLGFFVLVNSVVFWFVGRALKPVNTILQGLSQMQAGNFNARLPQFPLQEMSAISTTFNRMAETIGERTQENNRLALVVQQTSDAIVIHDREGRITFCNPAALQLFGYAAVELQGRPGDILAPEDKKTEFKKILDTTFRNEFQEHFETQRLTREGKLVEVALSTAPLVDPQSQQVVGAICSLRDITETRAAERTARELDESRRFAQLMQRHTEEERASMARELHDELGQCATAIKTMGMSIANRSAGRQPEIESEAHTIVSVAAQLYDMVHGMIRQLRPPVLDLGLPDALHDAAFTWQKRHPGIALKLECGNGVDGLPEAVNIAVYRIVQECLTNMARHSKASSASVHIARNGAGAIALQIQDNGVGSDSDRPFGGRQLGLRGMRERVEALQGTIAVDTQPGRGFSINILIPPQSVGSAVTERHVQ
jgi:two-component system, NarL family, sensor histidine kinase UhpB